MLSGSCQLLMTSAVARQLSETDMSLSRLPSHSRTLFVRGDGSPMRFYVRPGPVKRQLSPLIAHGGGIMCRVQESGVILLAQPGETHGPEYISTEYVKECVRRDQLLDAEEYWLSPGPKHRRGGKGAVRGKGPRKTGEVQEQHDGRVLGGEEHQKGRGVPGGEEHQKGRGVPGGEEHQKGRGVPGGEEHQKGRGVPGGEEHQKGRGVPGGEEHQKGRGVPGGEEHQKGRGVPGGEEHRKGRGVPGGEEHRKGRGVPGGEEHRKGRVVPRGEEHRKGRVVPGGEEHRKGRGVPGVKEQLKGGTVQEGEKHMKDGVVQGGEEHKIGEVHQEEGHSTNPEQHEGNSGVKRHSRDGHGDVEKKQELVKNRSDNSEDDSDAHDHERAETLSSPSVFPVGRRPFTKEEDTAILEYVRRNAPLRGNVSGVRLWQEMEEKCVLDRTWQSMKCRYRSYLADCQDGYKPPPSCSPQKNKITRHFESTVSSKRKALTPIKSSSTSPERGTPKKKRLGNSILGSPLKTLHRKDGEEKADGPGVLSPVQDDPVCGAALQSSTPLAGNMNDRCVIQENSEAASNTGADELRIFEIANLEFQIEDPIVEMTPTKRCPGLREFVMEEDSISQASMTQVDEVSSSPDVSEAEGLQKALLDMMSEFSLTLCDVTQALLKNNGEIGSTRHFLRTGARPDEYPIWERRDDSDLEKDGPTCHERLARKYGADNVAKRVAFLAS